MKILLIYPYFLEERLHVEKVSVVPIGLYYVAALLKENGYEVEILNWYGINRTPQEIQESLTEKKPDVIDFSILHANRWRNRYCQDRQEGPAGCKDRLWWNWRYVFVAPYSQAFQ